ncbi:hypothetical protein QQ045_021891 [Rhodiola kirilowii]
MEQDIQRRPNHELQLMPSSGHQIPFYGTSDHKSRLSLDPPAVSLDLQLSISLRPLRGPTETKMPSSKGNKFKFSRGGNRSAEEVKWEAAEQIRLAAMEKAYAERVRELARKEIELAHNELAHASHVRERAREEVERAERLKEQAARAGVAEGTCMGITCQCCRQRFVRP